MINTIQTNIKQVLHDVSAFNESSAQDTGVNESVVSTTEQDENDKQEEYKKLASNMNNVTTGFQATEEKFKRLKRDFDKKIKEIDVSLEDEENRMAKEF